MKNKVITSILITWFFSGVLLSLPQFPACALASDVEKNTIKYENMIPKLNHPWYFNSPSYIAIDADENVYIADTKNHRIQKFTSDGAFISTWGHKGEEEGNFFEPRGIAFDSDKNVYVVDSRNDRIQKFSSTGTFITKWGGCCSEDGNFDAPFGIAIDAYNNVFVADCANNRIQKFSSDGTFISKWGSEGSGDGEFLEPYGITVDADGNIIVADRGNNRIQKFSSDGTFISKWGSEGSGDGEFLEPWGITVAADGNIFVADWDNNRIQKFSSDGTFISKWGSWGKDDGQFRSVFGVAVDADGDLFTTDYENDQIQKFSSDGSFIYKWANGGSGEGKFYEPWNIAIDADGYIYVIERDNCRIQKFSSNGSFITMWGSEGSGDGEFLEPRGIAVDADGNVFVADTGNNRIQKFLSAGVFVSGWGSEGTGDGEFAAPKGIAVDAGGNVFVADWDNHRIQKFSFKGEFISKWGKEGGKYGAGDGEFHSPSDIAADADGNIFVVDTGNKRIQKFTSDGTFISKWLIRGSEAEELAEELNDQERERKRERGIAVDADGNVYVTDTGKNYHLQKFTSNGTFISMYGSFGSDPGQFNNLHGIAIGQDNRIYAADSLNNRIQIFTQSEHAEVVSKAVIVAGGGPYPGNVLWDATQTCANFAHRVLTYQGFTKENIYYLSSNTDLDLDGNGLFDDVDDDAASSNLQYAITKWAEGSKDLLIYITDHGGDGTFRMGENEILQAADLNSWFTEAEQAITGTITFIYDACRSGSFLPELISPAGKDRVLIASASKDQNAYFTSQGTLSFSYLFWGNVFNGMNLADSFFSAKNSVQYTYANQSPMLDDNGNGIGNEDDDGTIARDLYIGNGMVSAGDIPVINNFSSDQTLSDGSRSAVIHADEVTDVDGISRVWAVITPPDFSPGNPDEPVLTLPVLEMSHKEGSRYEETCNDFNLNGTYNVAIYASDGYGNISLPVQTSVTQTQGQTSHSTLGPDMSIIIPCIDVFGDYCSQINLDYYPNDSDPGNYFWVLVNDSVTGAECCDSSSTYLDEQMQIVISDLDFQGSLYQIKLNYYTNPYDTAGYYWKLDLSSMQ